MSKTILCSEGEVWLFEPQLWKKKKKTQKRLSDAYAAKYWMMPLIETIQHALYHMQCNNHRIYVVKSTKVKDYMTTIKLIVAQWSEVMFPLMWPIISPPSKLTQMPRLSWVLQPIVNSGLVDWAISVISYKKKLNKEIQWKKNLTEDVGSHDGFLKYSRSADMLAPFLTNSN